MKSNLVGCSTGTSAGLAPFKILSMNTVTIFLNIDRRQAVLRGQTHDLLLLGGSQRRRQYADRADTGLAGFTPGARVSIGAADFQGMKLQAELAGGGLMSCHSNFEPGLRGSQSTAARESLPMVCFIGFNRLPVNSDSTLLKPVTLPPGWAGLSTRPAATGAVTSRNIVGIVMVPSSRPARRRCPARAAN